MRPFFKHGFLQTTRAALEAVPECNEGDGKRIPTPMAATLGSPGFETFSLS